MGADVVVEEKVAVGADVVVEEKVAVDAGGVVGIAVDQLTEGAVELGREARRTHQARTAHKSSVKTRTTTNTTVVVDI